VYEIRIALGAGSATLEYLSCDLTAEYVRINADYSTYQSALSSQPSAKPFHRKGREGGKERSKFRISNHLCDLCARCG
jgi:hypothetical protein